MGTKHTPGPWAYRDGKIVAVDVQPDWATIDEDYADERVTVVDLCGAMGGHDSAADARLIAAAPELLAALEDFVSHAEAGFLDEIPSHAPDVYQNDLVRRCVAAIAKAKGE